MLKRFLKTYWENLIKSVITFSIYALADLSLVVSIGFFTIGKFDDIFILLNKSFLKDNIEIISLLLVLIFLLIRHLVLLISSRLGFQQIYKIYKDLGTKSIRNIITQKTIPKNYLQPGYMQKLLSRDIDFIIEGFVIPLSRLFIELLIFLIISTILITRIGVNLSLLVFTASLISFSFTIRKQSKVNKRLGKLRETSQEEKSKIIGMIQNSLSDIFSYRPVEYIVDKFSEVNNKTKENYQALQHQILIGRANFETLFTSSICVFIFLSLISNADQSNNLDYRNSLIITLALSTRLIPGIGRIIESFQSINYSLPCLREYYQKSLKDENEITLKNKRIKKFNSNNMMTIKNDFIQIKNQEIFYINKFELNKGSWTSIFGESGSGKSTFLGFIYKFMNEENKSLLSKIAYMPQSISMITNNIYENIALSNTYNKKEIDNLLKEFGLGNLINRYESIEAYKGSGILDLSGGQLQRIIIARAIYHNKNILILDEFTSALDYKNEKNILDILKKEQINNNITIICTSHKKIIQKYSDNVYMIAESNMKKLKL